VRRVVPELQRPGPAARRCGSRQRDPVTLPGGCWLGGRRPPGPRIDDAPSRPLRGPGGRGGAGAWPGARHETRGAEPSTEQKHGGEKTVHVPRPPGPRSTCLGPARRLSRVGPPLFFGNREDSHRGGRPSKLTAVREANSAIAKGWRNRRLPLSQVTTTGPREIWARMVWGPGGRPRTRRPGQ